MQTIIPVILSGGSGTRLWPLSRKHYPKQLLNLTGDSYTMLQETAIRVSHLSAPIIVCNEDHRFMVAEQMKAIADRPSSIILEPVARNTAPAIALAALQAIKRDSEAIIAIFPADHVIADQQVFGHSLAAAINEADSDSLVTFGIMPDKAETGYGYIKACGEGNKARVVESFIEKPDQKTAETYVKSGSYFWNSGMFVFKAKVYLAALERFNVSILKHCRAAMEKAVVDLDFIRVNKDEFARCPDDSIDYAVMEHARNVMVVPMDAGWNDVGSWSSLWEVTDKDAHQNAFIGDVIGIDCRNTLIHNRDKLVAAIGIEDIIVVDTKDALLISHKDQVQKVKNVVERLKSEQRSEHLWHREVHRPWGSYDSIDSGARYQVKRISVKPGASLSLQMHHHRAEHWVVVKGTALVQLGDEEKLLTENQSVYIPIGKTHRLTNPGKVKLELIEVQSGSYLGEDDIVRFEDVYHRT